MVPMRARPGVSCGALRPEPAESTQLRTSLPDLVCPAGSLPALKAAIDNGAAAVTAVASGDVDLSFATPPSVLPIAQTGKVKMIAVTSAERSPMFPDLPTVAEGGAKDFDYTFWFGLFGPKGLPQDVVDKLFAASDKALADPALVSLLQKTGNQVSTMKSPAEFAAWAKADGARGAELMAKSGAKVE